MRWTQAIPDLWEQLQAQRVRAALTVLSVTWGTLSVVLLLAFGLGMQAHMEERARGLGEGVVVAWPSRTTRAWGGFGPGRVLPVTAADVRALRVEVAGLAGVSPEFRGSRTVRRGARVFRVPLMGVDPCFAQLRNLVAQPGGRFVNAADLAERRRVLFLGDGIARSLFGAAEPVGARLVVDGMPFTVVGVLRPKEQDSDYGGFDSEQAFLPATTFSQLFGQRLVEDLVYRAADPRDAARVDVAVRAALARRHGFDPADADALPTWDLAEQQRMISTLFLAMNLVFGGSGAFTLLVGGVGVAHLMFLLVRRRTREIGVWLSVGARPSSVLAAVMAQAVVLVGAGGLLGFALSAAVLAVVRATPAVAQIGTPALSPALSLATAALLVLVGLVAGWFPARRAARVDPVVALAA